MTHPKMHFFNGFAVLLLIGSAAAQADSAPPLMRALPDFGALQAKAGAFSLRSEIMDAEPVKGSPFCVTISTEHTQNFADGNRIHTSDASTMCRDSEGRMRRESTLMLLGPAAQNSPGKLITIIDPVAGFRYVLDPNVKVARKMPLSLPSGPADAKAMHGATLRDAAPGSGNVMFYQAAGAPGPDVIGSQVFIRKNGQAEKEPDSTTENLGDQTIDGIHATGTRVTTTIAAGKMGNEQPMLITSERWYSPELKATVMTKHNDPWAGELKTQFTNVNASDPDPSLFAVPSDYKIVDEKDGPVMIKLPPLPPPPQ
ncbi:MAG: hypothetical protein JOZ80_08620 [Acidobacteriaceae bacterium]|nr:hypothetical protein [Acidobacteriaceae bacterium]